MNIPLFNYPPVVGHLGIFQVGAATNDTSMDIHVKDFVWTNIFISVGQIPRNGIVGSYDRWVLNFIINLPKCFPKQLHCFAFPPAVFEFKFFHIHSETRVISHFNFSHSNKYVMVSHNFNLHFHYD